MSKMLNAFKAKSSFAYPRNCKVSRNRTSSLKIRAASSWSGTNVCAPEKGHHFLHIDDFSKEELVGMLDTAREVKAKFRARDESFKPFQGKTLAMIFTKPSMRTRVSFETVRMGCLLLSS
jgi:ornithine carbamoyltransferase